MPDTERNAGRELTYRVVAMPADTNAFGDIFGGWLMSQVDIAGSILALREAEGRVATVAVKEFRFLAPVAVGDLISCYAEVQRRGQTSITVHVIAEACRQLEAHRVCMVADATLVYVALNEAGRPRHMPASLDVAPVSREPAEFAAAGATVCSESDSRSYRLSENPASASEKPSESG